MKSNVHIVFTCHYHVVWCPQYRRKVLVPPLDERLKVLIQEGVEKWEQGFVQVEVMPDHVHLLVGCDPQFGTPCSVLCKGTTLCMASQLDQLMSTSRNTWAKRSPSGILLLDVVHGVGCLGLIDCCHKPSAPSLEEMHERRHIVKSRKMQLISSELISVGKRKKGCSS